ncbi:hypothetical protein PC129_g25366 [Phytophthora cactorum]|uniref:Uncharacterized protein n=1 Tax=Phytophthora cactorum TaxID=29920 RepID=A0A8T1GSB7_9STRA|nr:hypothetical protein PC129_g25366 [Phytophthora cactorum]
MGDGNYMWFPNITLANSLTHYWAFWILCVTYIIKLRAEHPWLIDHIIEVDGEAPESHQVSKKMMQMAKWILQSV